MNITNKTVLITGGGSGIGFEIAKLLSKKNNKVIITGRTEATLQQAVSKLNNATYLVADITNAGDVQKLATSVNHLDILINNAAAAYAYRVSAEFKSYDKAADEINTNYLSVIRLTEALLPALRKSSEAAIVNVSSIVSFVPSLRTPTYSASKAALHAYTRLLRLELAPDDIKVFELMPPLVNTGLSKDIGGENGLPPEEVAQGLINGLTNDEFELHIGQTAMLYQLSLSSPEEALAVLNQPR